MIFWLTGGKTIDLGQAEIRQCEKCGERRTFHLVLSYRYFALYGIFSLVYKKDYYYLCDVCQNGWEIDKNNLERQLEQNPIHFWRRYSLIGFIGLIIMLGLTGFWDSEPKSDRPPKKTLPPPTKTIQPSTPATLTMPPVSLTTTWNYAVLYCEDIDNDRMHLRMLVVRERETAEQVIVRMKDGESFIKLASEVSIHPSAATGGDLGWLKTDDFSEELRLAVSGLGAGTYSTIIELSR